jgi:hypothetical protein
VTDIEQEARAEAVAWKCAEEYAPGDMEAQDDFVQGYLTASRPASPATREAVATAIRAHSDQGNISQRFIAESERQADALLAAFTITEKKQSRRVEKTSGGFGVLKSDDMPKKPTVVKPDGYLSGEDLDEIFGVERKAGES